MALGIGSDTASDHELSSVGSNLEFRELVSELKIKVLKLPNRLKYLNTDFKSI